VCCHVLGFQCTEAFINNIVRYCTGILCRNFLAMLNIQYKNSCCTCCKAIICYISCAGPELQVLCNYRPHFFESWVPSNAYLLPHSAHRFASPYIRPMLQEKVHLHLSNIRKSCRKRRKDLVPYVLNCERPFNMLKCPFFEIVEIELVCQSIYRFRRARCWTSRIAALPFGYPAVPTARSGFGEYIALCSPCNAILTL